MPVTLDGSAVFGDADVGWAGPGLVPPPNVVVRQNTVQVQLGDNTLDNVLGVKLSFGWDQPISTCDVELFSLPDGDPTSFYYQTVTVATTHTYLFGDDPSPDEVPPQTLRFVGMLVRWDMSNWPRSVGLHAEGHLFRAQEYKNEDGDQAPDEGKPGLALEDLLGTDAGGTIAQITTAVLTQAGVPDGGTWDFDDDPHLYGLEAPDQFVWPFREAALSYLHRLYEASAGWRLFHSGDGKLYLRQIVGRPNGQVDARFTAGLDILDSSKTSRGVEKTFNGVAIDGLNDGSDDPVRLVQLVGNPWQPVDTPILFPVHSQLIETQDYAVELATTFWIPEVNREVRAGTIVTWRDDVFGPGATYEVDDPERLDANGTAYWASKVTFEMHAPAWAVTQTISLVGGGDTNDGPPVPIT